MDKLGPFDLSFVAVGPQRTGTTWVYEMLLQHPALCLPEMVKETMFFGRRYDRGLDWYSTYFEHCGNHQLCGEVAPTYFDVPEIPERIYQIAPDCVIFINLRHPVERAFSLYLHHLRKGRVSSSFREAIEEKPRIITAGHYATHIPRWQSMFGENQVHFLFLSDIKNRPQVVLNEICARLEVDPLNQPSRVQKKVNAASIPRSRWLARCASALATLLHSFGLHWIVEGGKKLGLKEIAYTGGEEDMPELSVKDRKQAIQVYEEDIAFVERLTGKDLSDWYK
jgi:hypothetical protein